MSTTPKRRISLNQTTVTTTYTAYNGQTTTSTTGAKGSFDAETIVGSDVLNWRDKIAKRQNASSGYTCSKWDGDFSPPFMFSHVDYKVFLKDAWQEKISTYHPSFGKPSFFTDTGNYDAALRKLKNKLDDEAGHFSSLLPLAQINETRGLIRSTANSTADLFEELIMLKRGRGSLKGIQRAASNAWLNFSFGIKPTISDTFDLIESVGKALSDIDRNVTVSGHRSSTRNYTSPNQTVAAAGGVFNTRQIEEHELSCKFTGAFRIHSVASGNNYTGVDRFGLTFRHLPELAWEVVPYSWAVDYFTNIGEYLSAMFWAPPGQLIYFCVTERDKVNIRSTGSYKLTMGGAEGGHGSYSPYRAKMTHLRRQSLSVIPHQQLRFRSVDEIGRNALNKVFNLGAVLLQRR